MKNICTAYFMLGWDFILCIYVALESLEIPQWDVG